MRRAKKRGPGPSHLRMTPDHAGNVVGIDPHKRTLTATVADARGGILGSEHFRVSGEGHRELEAWARQFGPIARWGVENAAGWGRQNLLIARTLDDLYWVMSYSRWKDERYWPLFRDALLREHPSVTEEGLAKAKEFNAQRYYYQGIGRYDPDAAMARGLADLAALSTLIPPRGYVHGGNPTSVDAGIYGFIANIYFYEIDTPLKAFVVAHDNIVQHCRAIHEAVR